jgi:multidrug efflux pump subunit AcrA (membrane-fusion protein)
MTMALTKMTPARRAAHAWLLAGALSLSLFAPAPVGAHGPTIKTSGGAKGPVRLSTVQERALGLTLAPATRRPVAQLLYLNGEVRPVAGRQAQANSRIPGQVTQVYVTLGQSVRAGQRLARVQSRLVGDPPPSVDITAPISGIIDEVGVSTGQAIEPTTALFRLRDSREVNVLARVYEEDLGKIQVGQAATLRLISYPDRLFAGRVKLVGPSLDPLTRTVEVWVSVDGDTGLLKPNLFARVGVILRQDTGLTVPNAAVIEANGEKFVFLRQPDGYARVEIETGVRDARFTEVREGLVPGDRVVVQGNRQVYTLWLTGGVPLRDEDD